MRNDDLHVRVAQRKLPRQHLEHQDGVLQRGTEWPSEVVVIEKGRAQPSDPRMEEHHGCRFVKLLKEWVEDLVNRRHRIVGGRKVHGLDSELMATAVQL